MSKYFAMFAFENPFMLAAEYLWAKVTCLFVMKLRTHTSGLYKQCMKTLSSNVRTLHLVTLCVLRTIILAKAQTIPGLRPFC
jgi:hypothetical protein